MGGPQGWSGEMQKILLLPGFDTQTVQPVASQYADYLIHLFNTAPEGHFLLNMRGLTSDISGRTAAALLRF